MSSPVRQRPYQRGTNRQNVIFSTKHNWRIRAPRGGVVRTRRDKKDGIIVTTPGGYRHRIDGGVRPLRSVLGKRVEEGDIIGHARGKRVRYKRWDKHGKQRDAMKVVKRPKAKSKPKVRKPWDGSRPIGTRMRYRSGSWHGSWDVLMPIGTKLYSPIRGTVALTGDGVHNNRPGYTPGSGAPSNFVLIYGYDKHNRKRTYYSQHMNKGIKVRRGQRVEAGTYLGRSGNSGNTTGPHLHANVQLGWVPRYSHFRNHGLAVYPPSKLWS